MDQIEFADGFDTPDTLAFGLGAGQLAVVMAGALAAYSLVRSSLPPAIVDPAAVLLAGAGGGARVAQGRGAAGAGLGGLRRSFLDAAAPRDGAVGAGGRRSPNWSTAGRLQRWPARSRRARAARSPPAPESAAPCSARRRAWRPSHHLLLLARRHRTQHAGHRAHLPARGERRRRAHGSRRSRSSTWICAARASPYVSAAPIRPCSTSRWRRRTSAA